MPDNQHFKNLPDRELLQRIEKNAEPGAIGTLLERYSHLIVIVCLKYMDKEADVSLTTQKILHQLNIDLQNHHIKNFSSWVYRLTRQYCLPSRTSNPQVLLTQNSEDYPDEDFPELLNPATLTSSEKAGWIMRLQTVFTILEKEEQDCITQFYIEGKTFEEIARQKALPAETIRKKIREGKKKMAAALATGKI